MKRQFCLGRICPNGYTVCCHYCDFKDEYNCEEKCTESINMCDDLVEESELEEE